MAVTAIPTHPVAYVAPTQSSLSVPAYTPQSYANVSAQALAVVKAPTSAGYSLATALPVSTTQVASVATCAAVPSPVPESYTGNGYKLTIFSLCAFVAMIGGVGITWL